MQILLIGTDAKLLKRLAATNITEVISSINFLDSVTMRFIPSLVVLEEASEADARFVRDHDRLVKVPILILREKFTDKARIETLADIPRVTICNQAVARDETILAHFRLLYTKQKPMLPARTSAFVKYAILYMNLHLGDKITRQDLATYAGVAEDYLTRIFRQEMGISPWSYLLALRLETARSLLEKTSGAVGDIASRCGFAQLSHFDHAFKKRFGISPGDLRREM